MTEIKDWNALTKKTATLETELAEFLDSLDQSGDADFEAFCGELVAALECLGEARAVARNTPLGRHRRRRGGGFR